MIEFFRVCLKSYGIIAFAPHLIPSAILLAATFYNPVMGLSGVIGNVISNLTGSWLHPNKEVFKSGVFGINGILFGIALPKYTEMDLTAIVYLIIGAIFTGLVSLAISVLLEKIDIPVLSIPFTVIFWLFVYIIGSGYKGDMDLRPLQFMKSMDLWLFEVLPFWMFEYIKMFGSIFFQDNLISGFLVLASIFLFSRISVLFGLWGGLTGMITYYFLNGSLSGFHGLNFVLIALAFGGFFLVFNRHVILLTTIAVIITGFVENGSTELLEFAGLPVLVLPFNLVAVLILAPVKKLFHSGYPLKVVPVPLYLIKSPESNIRWYARYRDYRDLQKTQITPPFLGEWTILQGNDGEWTHKKTGRFAWDFIIRDASGSQAKGIASRLEDYYAFGLPVLAPASGLVVAAENSIIDNPAGTANTEQNWGNYVIIDHQNGEFSEISHMKHGSLTVYLGQYVKRGDIIGYCGNSGRSPVPHIHYQLQVSSVLGSETKPALFSQGVLNGKPATRFNPDKGETLAPLDIDSDTTFSLLGRESEIWTYQTTGLKLNRKEILFFTTDEFGIPVMSMKNNRRWYIIEMPDFFEIKPDFKTYPSKLSPSQWLNSVGESLLIPRFLMDGFTWDQGEVRKAEGNRLIWEVITNDYIFAIEPDQGITRICSVTDPERGLKLLSVNKLEK